MGKYNQKARGRLQPKLIRSVLIIVLIAFFAVTMGVIFYFSSIYRKQEIENQVHQLERIVDQITFWQTTTTNITKQIAIDSYLQEGVNAKEEISAQYSLTRRGVHLSLLTYAHIVDSIQEITIYTVEGKTFSSAEKRGNFYPEKSPWYTQFKALGKQRGYTAVHKSTKNQDKLVMDVISYVLTYYSTKDTRKELGDIIISMDYSVLQNISKMDISVLNGYCLYDSQGIPILEKGQLHLSYEEAIAQNKNGVVDETSGDILVISEVMQDGWIMVTEISGKELQKRTWMIEFYLAVTFTVVAITLWAILAFFIRRVVNPINQLSKTAVEVGNGNFDVSVDIRTNDELEDLADMFNIMVLDIKKLMEESVEHEKVSRKMQIDQLMLQINPHFIYNTLNSIVYMARMNGNREIADFANAFISLLQSTLRIRDSIYISLREELKNVEHYLLLQKYRYIDKFDVEIHCEEDLKECAIPNVMLQPIVENAIFHGLAPKEEKGVLIILVTRESDTLKISVEDNGVGMTPEMIEELMSEVNVNRGGMRKIGIANVSKRITQIFGDSYGMSVESSVNVGTKVTMTIPYQIYSEAEGRTKNG